MVLLTYTACTTCFGCRPNSPSIPPPPTAYRLPPQQPYLSRYSLPLRPAITYLQYLPLSPPTSRTSLLNIHKIYLSPTSHLIPSSRCCCCCCCCTLPDFDLIDYRPLTHLPNFYRVGLMILSSVWVFALCNLHLHSKHSPTIAICSKDN